MTRNGIVRTYVAFVFVASLASLIVSWHVRETFPGWMALCSLWLVAVLLDRSPLELRVSAQGSTSFVIHIAAGALFGGFWGGLVAACGTLTTSVSRKLPLERILFNPAQRALSVTLGAFVYQFLLGGEFPPSFLDSGVVTSTAVQRDLFFFFAMAGTYVLANKLLVAGAAALSTDRPFREVWHLNARGMLGYDLGASVISMLVAWFYVRMESIGYGPVGLVAVVVPIVGLRHVYALYQNLEESGQELLQVMVKAIEARDPYTSGHSLRVRELSRAIAIELNLPAAQIEEVETAALLHDVGKIHEEFAPLLRKEARLTDEETALMQTHAMKSADLVGIIRKFRGSVQRAVRHHHERWDGQGYPDGIRETEIPLAARVILIADTVDAMTTDRPYRKRLPLEVVIAELQRCKGTQFDPEVVDIAVSSVSVRRLIAGPDAGGLESERLSPRSLRVPRASGAFWKARRA